MRGSGWGVAPAPVGSTAFLITRGTTGVVNASILASRTNRTILIIRNIDAQGVLYIADSNAETTATGYQLRPGEQTPPIPTSAQIFAIASQANTAWQALEVYNT